METPRIQNEIEQAITDHTAMSGVCRSRPLALVLRGLPAQAIVKMKFQVLRVPTAVSWFRRSIWLSTPLWSLVKGLGFCLVCVLILQRPAGCPVLWGKNKSF